MVENTAVLGVKDAQKNLFEVWTEILQVPSSKKWDNTVLSSDGNMCRNELSRQQLTLQLDDPLKRSGKVSLARSVRNFCHSSSQSPARLLVSPRRLEMTDLVSSVGAYDRIYDGLFEHYLTLNFHDPKLTSVSPSSCRREDLVETCLLL